MATNLARPIGTVTYRAQLLIAALVFLAAEPVVAQVYIYRDAEGVCHFTTTRRPGAEPFDLGETRDPGSPDGDPEGAYDGIIRELAGEHGVDPALVKAMIRAESRFDPAAVSPKGARGLMQIMPRVGRRHGAKNLYDPRENIRAGVRHLRSLLVRFDDDTKLALAAYNAGSRVVARYRGLPPYRETRAYVAKVLRFRREYRQRDAASRAT